MAGSNGATPTRDHADPSGVFGRIGATLPLGDQSVTVRMLSVRETKAAEPLFNAMSRFAASGSVGQQHFDYANTTGTWEPLAAWLSAWCTPAVTVEMLQDALGDEIIALIDTIFSQSGMAWLKRFLETDAVKQAIAQLEATPPENSPGLPEKDSTPTTTSSSTPPDRRRTPEQTSPKTG